MLAVAAVVLGLGSSAGAQTVADVIERDRLIASQEALLNAYRCRFSVDVAAVPGGCASGEPVQPAAGPGAFSGTPTQSDIDAREKLIANQEKLLNTLRCRFGVDTDAVSGGCPDTGEQAAPQDDAPAQQPTPSRQPTPAPSQTESDPGASPEGQQPEPLPWVGQRCVEIEKYGEDSNGWVYNDPNQATCTMFENVEYIINHPNSRAALHYVSAYGSRVLICPQDWKTDDKGLCRYPRPQEASIRNMLWRQRFGEEGISIEFSSDASSQSAVFIPLQLIVLTDTT